MNLSHFVQGRDNNFNLIRIIAAVAVLVTHCFALAIGSGSAEPLRSSLGTTLGGLGVDIFFITSGFLVTGSLLTRQNAIEFFWARALRIYPALLVMVFLTVFVLGVFFTLQPLSTYFTERGTLVYLVKNSTLLAGVAYTLPGVFEAVPYKKAVNGSLWTMPYEIRMYLTLAAIWILASIAPKYRVRTFKLTVVALAAGAAVAYLPGHFPLEGESGWLQLFFMFFVGAAFYVLKDYIPLSSPFFVLCTIALAISSSEKHAFFVVYNLLVAYILFYLAYKPAGILRAYNRLGDYSYGVYIYAFPVQQSAAALIPGVSVAMMLAISLPISIAMAAISWHLIERRALDLKGAHADRLRRLASYYAKWTSTR